MKCWEGDYNEKVILRLFFNLRQTRPGGGGGEPDRENGGHYNPPRSPETPLVGLNQESMGSNFDASRVTRFKTW